MGGGGKRGKEPPATRAPPQLFGSGARGEVQVLSFPPAQFLAWQKARAALHCMLLAAAAKSLRSGRDEWSLPTMSCLPPHTLLLSGWGEGARPAWVHTTEGLNSHTPLPSNLEAAARSCKAGCSGSSPQELWPGWGREPSNSLLAQGLAGMRVGKKSAWVHVVQGCPPPNPSPSSQCSEMQDQAALLQLLLSRGWDRREGSQPPCCRDLPSPRPKDPS